MLPLLKLKLREVVKDVAPLVGTVCLLQVLLVHAPLGLFLQFLAGSALSAIGMMLLFAGIDLGVLPMGRYIGAELPRQGSLRFIVAVAFGLGYLLTGSVAIASALALLEPLANTIAYYAHERLWARLSANTAAVRMKSAMAAALPQAPSGVETRTRTASEACSSASGA